jgi:hypothetical protein
MYAKTAKAAAVISLKGCAAISNEWSVPEAVQTLVKG